MAKKPKYERCPICGRKSKMMCYRPYDKGSCYELAQQIIQDLADIERERTS